MSVFGDSLMAVAAGAAAVIIVTIFPLMSLADRNDDISQMAVQASVTEFGDKVTKTGTLTEDDLTAFQQEINAETGANCEIEMEVRVLDENPRKKTTQASPTKEGENVSYSMYTSQILDALPLTLKEGDMFIVRATTDTSISKKLNNFFYSVAGEDTNVVAAEYSGRVD